jgi:hypothetical protein
MLDTIYYDVLYKANEKEANPGLYHVKPFMPPNYFPHMVSTEVEVKPKELIEVIVEGYGLLLVEAFSGIPEKWATRIDIFTKERNSKTKERTWLAYFNSNDTMHLAPGNYWMVAQYPIPVEREISIQSNSMLTERIENIGILLITNGTNSKEWVEITDMETARKTSVRNNTPVDIESGKKYTVAVFKSNGTIKTFTDVEIDPKQTTVIRW